MKLSTLSSCKYLFIFLLLVLFQGHLNACDGMDLNLSGTVDNGDGTWTYYITACIEPDNGTGAPTEFILTFSGATAINSYSPAAITVPGGATWNASTTGSNVVRWGSGGISTADATHCQDFVITVSSVGGVPEVRLDDGNACGNLNETPPAPCHTVGVPILSDLTAGNPYDCTDNTNYSITALDAAGSTHFTNGISIVIETDSWTDTEGSLTITGSDGSSYTWGPSAFGSNYQGALPGGGNFTYTITNVAAGTVFTIDWIDSAGDGSFDYTFIDNATGKSYEGTFSHSGDFGQTDYQVVLDALGGSATFSGNGITDNGDGTAEFNPNGLSAGTHTITYTWDNGQGCSETVTQEITVDCAVCDPSWAALTLCEDNAVIDLTTLVTGDAGGTWSGSGVTGSSFNPSGLSGNITVTYDLGGGCTEDHDFSIDALPDPSWTPTTLCATQAPIDLSTLITGDAGGTWSGSGVSGTNFDPNGLTGAINVTYTVVNGLCSSNSAQNITVTSSSDASWTAVSHCESNGTLDLTTLVTGDAGGTWTGTGVTGTNFDPSSLSGNISLTYTVGGAGCQDVITQDITVDASVDPSWTGATLCAGDASIDLTTLVTGDAGGTWSGSGVTGNIFDPSGQNGAITVTYTVTNGTCVDSQDQTVTVTTNADPTWITTDICENANPLDLSTLVTGDAGGTWTGAGVTANNFDPTGLSGTVSLTYTVGPAACQGVLTGDITVSQPSTPVVDNGVVCETQGLLDLTTLNQSSLTMTWSGVGVSGSDFDPNGLAGTNTITYTFSEGVCTSSGTISVEVTNSPSAQWAFASSSINSENTPPIDLDNLLDPSALSGGTWSGTGVTDGNFDPTGLSGDINVTYSVGVPGCGDQVTQTITVFSEFVIHFYNAFSPNNDGKNDEFKPLGTFHLANSYKMMIYNRWGDLVFETDEPSVGWNGCKDNLIGVKQIQGLYSYVVHLTDHLGDKQKYVGQVVLLR